MSLTSYVIVLVAHRQRFSTVLPSSATIKVIIITTLTIWKPPAYHHVFKSHHKMLRSWQSKFHLHAPPQTLPTQSATSSSTSSTTPRRPGFDEDWRWWFSDFQIWCEEQRWFNDMISLDAAQAADMRMARCNRDMIKAEPPLIVSLVKVFWNKMSEVATTHIKTISIIMKAHYSHTESVLLKIMYFSFLRPNFQVHCSLFFVLSNPIQSNTIQREYRLFRFTSTPVSFIRHLNIFCH